MLELPPEETPKVKMSHMDIYGHFDLQFGLLTNIAERSVFVRERQLAAKWLLEFFEYLLSDTNRSYENLVFTSADELLNEEHDGQVRDTVWMWLTQAAQTADDRRQEIMDVCIFERVVEDEPLEWDWRTFSMFTLWFNPKTHWVFERAYSYFPDRLDADLKEFAKLCTEKCIPNQDGNDFK